MVFNAVTNYLHCNMLFSNKDKALIKNVYQFKKYGLQRILTNFLKTYCKKRLNTSLTDLENAKHITKGMRL